MKPLLSSALRYINSNLFTIKSVKEVADSIFVTEGYLYKLFKNIMKESPKQYILNKRLNYARNMIQLGEKPIQVARVCNFENYSSFYRAYMKQFGHAPSKEEKDISGASGVF